MAAEKMDNSNLYLKWPCLIPEVEIAEFGEYKGLLTNGIGTVNYFGQWHPAHIYKSKVWVWIKVKDISLGSRDKIKVNESTALIAELFDMKIIKLQ